VFAKLRATVATLGIIPFGAQDEQIARKEM